VQQLRGTACLGRCQKRMARGCLAQMPGDDLPDGRLQGFGGQPRARGVCATRNQPVGDIVGKAPPAPLCMGRAKMIAGLIPELAHEDARICCGWTAPTRWRACGEQLHRPPEPIVNDCGMLAGLGQVLVPNDTAVSIPAAARDGQILRLRGKGSPGTGGGLPGDATRDRSAIFEVSFRDRFTLGAERVTARFSPASHC
jgi:hypothetical protein